MENKMKGSLLLLTYGEYEIKDSNGIEYKYRLGFSVIDMTVMIIVYKDLEEFYKVFSEL